MCARHVFGCVDGGGCVIWCYWFWLLVCIVGFLFILGLFVFGEYCGIDVFGNIGLEL